MRKFFGITVYATEETLDRLTALVGYINTYGEDDAHLAEIFEDLV